MIAVRIIGGWHLWLCALTALLATALGAASAAAQSPVRVALVIGNNDYKFLSSLRNPRLDAERLAKTLHKNGFEVFSCGGTPGCFDLTSSAFGEALRAFRDKAAAADLALVFYAGHGMESLNQNVLVPVDADLDCQTRQLVGGVRLDAILDSVAKAKEKVVVLDACRDDAIAAACPALGRSARASFRDFKIPDADRFLLVSSTKPGQTASDGLPGAHSPFALALFDTLQTSPSIYFHQVFDRVAKVVIVRSEKSGFVQIPEVLIRGGAPEDCLSGGGCAADPEAASLKSELDALRAARARDQDLTQIAKSYLETLGVKAANRPLSDEEKQRALIGLKQVGQALIAMSDEKSTEALEKLRAGDSEAAEGLFGALLSGHEAEIAAAQQRSAKHRRDAAKAARHLAALNRPKDVAKALSFFKRAVALEPDDVDTWIQYGEVAREAGKLTEARSAFAQASTLATNETSPVLRTKAAYRLGEIAKELGITKESRRLYLAALDLANRAVTSDPLNVEWQHNLSVAQEKVGDLRVAEGNISEALDIFRASLAIRQRLASVDPNNAGSQRDLTIALNKVGDVLAAQGDVASALAAFHASLAIREKLVNSDGANTVWQRDLSVAHERVGNVLVAQAKLKEALQHFQSSLAIRQQLAASDQGNAGWQRDVAVARERIGDMLLEERAFPRALDMYRASQSARQRLAAADPKNATWQRELSVSLNKVGDALQAQGMFRQALPSYRESLAIRERLLKTDPENAQHGIDLALVYARLGKLHLAMGGTSEARRYFVRGRRVMAPIAARADNPLWHQYLESLEADIAALENRPKKR